MTPWETKNYKTHIVQYLKNERQSEDKIWKSIEHNMRNIFVEKLCRE